MLTTSPSPAEVLLRVGAPLSQTLSGWVPPRVPAEDLDLARPHLAPALSWSRLTSDRDAKLTHAEQRCALFAINLLACDPLTANLARSWLHQFGTRPMSAGAQRAVEGLCTRRPCLDATHYVRAMSCYSMIGVWEFVLAKSFADPITPNLRACELQGTTPAQLWANYHCVWATRPPLWPPC